MMADLSIEAKAMMLGVFLSPKTKLTMHNVESVLSPKAAKGMSDLQEAGLVTATPDRGAVIYQLTEAGMALDRRSIVKGDPFKWMKEHASFPIAVKKVRS